MNKDGFSSRNKIHTANLVRIGAVASHAASRELREAFIAEKHEQWMAKHGRVYKDAAEKESRFKIFMDNAEFMETFNKAGNRSYNLGLNKFADLTNEEFRESLCLRHSKPTPFRYKNVTSVPFTMDWRKKGAVTAVKGQGECAKLKGYEMVPKNNEKALLKAVANQPVSVCIDSSGRHFQHYSSGVLTGDCGTNLDHGVTAIGYGTSSDGIKYWLIKNSWGTGWGENGYLRMQRDIGAEKGLVE
ncbi:unnamed protein product [Thlaspi arvense]|uniref:Uncharacterized protein n=1 Tax=Thlaspi arvense TaxID=13288 RepID=A0AAU9RW95_THLAR|nr:unnamed protein product [Thlaspi arvense]